MFFFCLTPGENMCINYFLTVAICTEIPLNLKIVAAMYSNVNIYHNFKVVKFTIIHCKNVSSFATCVFMAQSSHWGHVDCSQFT